MAYRDLLVPEYGAVERHAPLLVSVFNLVATIVGGGELSLPLAFCKLGIVLATILMIFAAIITDLSLYLLCLCARMTGASSYGEVGRMAFGPWMEQSLSVLLFIFLLFVIVGYSVLIRDIWTPLVGILVPSASNLNGNLVLLCILLLLSPFLVQRTLYALRFNCYVGFCSVSILCIALCHHGFFGSSDSILIDETDDEYDDGDNDEMAMLYFTTNFSDTLFAFPIIMLAFLSHFNVIPIQGALIRPSRTRMRFVVNAAVGACFTLMYLFGLGGYAYAGPDTKGNILLNVSAASGDWMFLLGRIGCGITIMLAVPMMTLPCRESLLEVAETLFTKTEDELDVTIIGEQTALLRHDPIRQDPLFRNPAIHYGSTFGIILVCYLGAAAVPSVAIVWSVCGSTMAFLIAFILPALYYIRIQKKEHTEKSIAWVIFAWALLIFSVLGAIACTIQTVWRLLIKKSV